MSEEVTDDSVTEAAPATTPEAEIASEPREARRGGRERAPGARDRGARESESGPLVAAHFWQGSTQRQVLV